MTPRHPSKLLSEKAVQRAVVALYRSMGCEVYSLSQPRASMQAAGLPDLWVFAPRVGRAFWHEVKSVTGKPSPDQVRFEDLCGSTGVHHVMGGVAEAKRMLIILGVIAKVA